MSEQAAKVNEETATHPESEDAGGGEPSVIDVVTGEDGEQVETRISHEVDPSRRVATTTLTMVAPIEDHPDLPASVRELSVIIKVLRHAEGELYKRLRLGELVD